MLKDYKEPSVHCVFCNDDIGKQTGSNCKTCGYSTTESLIYWIKENKKFMIFEDGYQT